MKVALVLSGGGAKGGFQVGALQYIYKEYMPQHPDFDWSIIAGVSVGALNGAMIAQKKVDEMIDVWHTISNDSVYSGYDVISFAQRVLKQGLYLKSIMSNDPLKELIKQHDNLSDVKYDLRVGITSLASGEYRSVKSSELLTDTELQQIVLASTIMPIVWEPMFDEPINGEWIYDIVDGGVRNVSPLGDVLGDDPTHVIIINCSSLGNQGVSSKRAAGIDDIAMRTVDIMVSEIFNSDIREFERLNRLVLQASQAGVVLRKEDGTPYVGFKEVLVQPGVSMGDSLDFSQQTVRMRVKHGFEQAQKAFSDFVP